MATELKPCPFCGGKAEQDYGYYDYNWHGVHCVDCGAYVCTTEDDPQEAIKSWNRRIAVETSFYDKEETFQDCTVQVLTNTATGETSVGWWKNGN